MRSKVLGKEHYLEGSVFSQKPDVSLFLDLSAHISVDNWDPPERGALGHSLHFPSVPPMPSVQSKHSTYVPRTSFMAPKVDKSDRRTNANSFDVFICPSALPIPSKPCRRLKPHRNPHLVAPIFPTLVLPRRRRSPESDHRRPRTQAHRPLPQPGPDLRPRAPHPSPPPPRLGWRGVTCQGTS